VSEPGAACYIGGQWQPTAGTFSVMNPADGTVVGEAADAGPEDARAAIAAATAAFPAWSEESTAQRGMLLRALSRELLYRLDPIAHTIVAEQGKPLGQALFEVRYATQWLDWFAEEGRRAYGRVVPSPVPGKHVHVLRQPVGVAVAITPWNFPLAMIARKLAPAMAAGCTMVVKPAEQTPLSAVRLFEAIDAAKFPPGVLNLITSASPEAIAPALLQDDRVAKITFTGSTEVGKILVRASADRLQRVSLELGGQAPFIVFDDADLDAAVSGLLASKFQVAGQSCLCANRIYVQRAIEEEFTERVLRAVSGLAVGNGTAHGTDIGPLIDERALAKVGAHVADARTLGGQVLIGGDRAVGGDLDQGWFFSPTVIAGCTDDMLCAQDETFGPVVPLFAFDEEDEVVARANSSRYGLAAYLYTKDLGRALRVSRALQYGIVGVNDPTPATPVGPFGGFKESGLGREGGTEGLDEFLESKLVSFVS
jgi:succinate-semialdehyde dehydrogenase/glutarate-semialdehyde dehydrogenase